MLYYCGVVMSSVCMLVLVMAMLVWCAVLCGMTLICDGWYWCGVFGYSVMVKCCLCNGLL